MSRRCACARAVPEVGRGIVHTWGRIDEGARAWGSQLSDGTVRTCRVAGGDAECRVWMSGCDKFDVRWRERGVVVVWSVSADGA